MQIIAFCGLPNSGKSTAASALANLEFQRTPLVDLNFAYAHEIIADTAKFLQHQPAANCWRATGNMCAFSDNVKTIASAFCDLPPHVLWNNCKQRSACEINGVSIRKLLQFIGMRGREYQRDIWIRAFDISAHACVVIHDLRFENEYKFLRALQAEIYYCWREGNNAAVHVSDCEHLKFADKCTVIYNYGTRSEFCKKIKNLIKLQ